MMRAGPCVTNRFHVVSAQLDGGPARRRRRTMNTCPRCGAIIDGHHPLGTCGVDDEPGVIYFDGYDTRTDEERREAIVKYQAEWSRRVIESGWYWPEYD